jgi:hypothetical protein
MKPLVAVDENAREYPQKNHWNIATEDAQETAQIKDRADFRLARPEYKNAESDISHWLDYGKQHSPRPGIMNDT